MSNELVKDIALWVIPLYAILVLIPTIILFRKSWNHGINDIFDKVDIEWIPQVEKPRLLFATFGYIFVISAWKLIKLHHWGWTTLATLLSIIGLFILYFILTKTFENRFIKHIKEKLNISRIKSILGTNPNEVEQKLDNLNNKYLISDLYTFLDLSVLNVISENNKIQWLGTTADLIRFIFILFDIKPSKDDSLDHNNVRSIIEHYFEKENKPIKLTATGSEISNIKKEIVESKEIFTNYEEILKKTLSM